MEIKTYEDNIFRLREELRELKVREKKLEKKLEKYI